MSGIANWQAQIRIDIEDLKKRIKVAEGEINNFTNEDRKVKLDIDTNTLESAIQKLDKMLDSLGKGTGDFKQFENLSKELSSIVSEVQSLSKVFGKVDDSGAKTLLSSIQNIDKSLSELSQNILNVNKNMSNIGGNTSGAVKQAENISNAYQDAAKEAEKLADAQSKIGQKTNISSGRKDAFHSDIDTSSGVKSLENLEEEIKKIFTDANELQNILDSLHNGKYFHLSWTTDGIDATGADERVRQLSKLLKEYGYTINNFKSDSDAFDTSGVINAIKEENNVLEQNTQKVKENTQAKEQNSNTTINKYDRRLDSYQGKMNGYENTLRKFSEGGWTSKDYLNNVIAVKDALSNYENAINSIKEKGFITQDDIQSLDRYEAKLKETIYAVQNMSASQKGYTLVSGQKELDKIDRLLEENTNLTRQAKEQIRAYYNEIASGNPSASLDVIHGKILEIINDEKEAGRGGKRFIDTLNNKAFYNFAQQLGTMFSLYDVINGVKQASSAVIQLNSDIIDLAKVSEATSSQIYADFSSYADIAKEIGGTISDTISATADWSRNGYTIPDSKELARVALLYKNVGDGIDIDAANESLISTLRGFQLEADQAEHIVDVFNEVDTLASYYSNIIALCVYTHIDSNYIG